MPTSAVTTNGVTDKSTPHSEGNLDVADFNITLEGLGASHKISKS